jgi:hypothetical protein
LAEVASFINLGTVAPLFLKQGRHKRINPSFFYMFIFVVLVRYHQGNEA